MYGSMYVCEWVALSYTYEWVTDSLMYIWPNHELSQVQISESPTVSCTQYVCEWVALSYTYEPVTNSFIYMWTSHELSQVLRDNVAKKLRIYCYISITCWRLTHCNTLQHTATHCNTLQHTAVHCNTLQHTATHCNTLQHTATHCNMLPQNTSITCRLRVAIDILHHTATHCNTLQNTTIHCNKIYRLPAGEEWRFRGCARPIFPCTSAQKSQRRAPICETARFRRAPWMCSNDEGVVRMDENWKKWHRVAKTHTMPSVAGHFRKRSTNYRALSPKMIYNDKAFYDSTIPCNLWIRLIIPRLCLKCVVMMNV